MMSIKDVHLGLPSPVPDAEIIYVKGSYSYYHYLCDGINDVGWGCGYRTLQTICSWIQALQNSETEESCCTPEVPSILDLQKALVKLGDKVESFVGSKQWIGTVEVAYCIDFFYKVQSRIIHCRNVQDLELHSCDIINHFREYGSPIMMGGDRDCSSKGVLGICKTDSATYLLILDPHFQGKNVSKEDLQIGGWIKWQEVNTLDQSSFYNLCCPLLKRSI